MIRSLIKKSITFIITLEARLVLFKYKPTIIAVTGSVGKTGTKDAIYAGLKGHLYIERSKKSYNSEIGVPLAILQADTGWGSPLLWLENIVQGLALIFLKNHYPKFLVLETGVDRPGDMSRITSLITPSIAIVTKLPEVPVHVEYFSSPKQVHNEKWELVEATKNGTVVVNNDDEAIRERIGAIHEGTKCITYGYSEDADVKASYVSFLYSEDGTPEGITFKVDYEGKNVPVKIIGTVGEGYVYAALAAIAVGVAEGIHLIKIIEGLSDFSASPGRSKIITGIQGSIIIDDSYNSSPSAVALGLETLSKIETKGKKVAVLGDMLELGKFTGDAHKELGELVAARGIDELYTVGPRAEGFAIGAHSAGMKKKDIYSYLTAEKAGNHLKKKLSEGDVVYVKGSQGIRLEKLTECIMAHPEKKSELLPRQEHEWERR